MKKTLVLFCIFIAVAFSGALHAAPMTNADVIKMIGAGLDEAVIINSIKHAENGFDTSASGLIALNDAKVPKPIIDAVIQRASAVSSKAEDKTEDTYNTGDVYLIDAGAASPMSYVSSETRRGTRAMGWGGSALYIVLQGPKAPLRLKASGPIFLVVVPEKARAENYVVLANFEVRKNNTREVLSGGGGFDGSMSTGIHKNRVVAVSVEKYTDQSKAPTDGVIYKVTPKESLKAGEYAFIVGMNFYDFGVN